MIVALTSAWAGPTVLAPGESPARPARHHALIIGVGGYSDPAYRDSARGAPGDAEAMATLLAQSAVPFDLDDTGSLLVGSVNASMLASALAHALDGLGANDDLLVYFAGHAVPARLPGGSGADLVLVASDARADAPPALQGVSLTAALLDPLLEHAPARVLVVVDACRGDGAAPPPPSSLRTAGDPGVWAVAFASGPGRPAADTGSHGVFTESLLAGATLGPTGYPADTDSSGGVTSLEWLLFALAATSARPGASQQPQALIDVRGRERFVLFGVDRTADDALVWAAAHPVRVRSSRGPASGPGVAVPAGIAGIRVEGPSPASAWVRLRPGEAFRADQLAEEPPGKLYVGPQVAATDSAFGSVFAGGAAIAWVPHDLLGGRTTLTATGAWGFGPAGDLRFPNATAAVAAAHGLTVVSSGAHGLDRVDLGPSLGVGTLLRWPEAGPGGSTGGWESHLQAGLTLSVGATGHVEVGRTRLGVEVGATAPFADGSWAWAPTLGLSWTTRVAQWGAP